jgi:hypothetical protein
MAQTLTDDLTAAETDIKPEDIHMPPNSFWPILLALGFVLILAGAAINIALAIGGLILFLVSLVGWLIEPV